MKILKSSEMKEIDRASIEEFGIPGPVLMENAGLQVTWALTGRYPEPAAEKIVIVAGRGNNGGDGLVAARHLLNAGASPKVLLLASRGDVKGDAAVNLAIAEKLGISVSEIQSAEEWARHRAELRQATVIVDALFGTGLAKPLEGLFAKAVEDINKAPGFTISVDIPSGLSSDTFEVIGPCVNADLTVTFAAPKIAHVFPPAEEFVGDLLVTDISVPPALLAKPGLKLELIEADSVEPFFAPRPRDTHKGDYGHLLVVSGSLGKTGAAALAGKAALKSGAGLVTVATPLSCLPAVARSMMELMTEPLEETPTRSISVDALSRALELMKGKDALLVGPGLSTHPSTAEFVRLFIPEIKVPAVIDADALNIISGDPEILDMVSCLAAPVVFTPHPGEFARLAGRPIADVLKFRLEMAPAFAEKYGVILVLKGYRTLVAAPDGRVFVNATGNPGMATGGSGDVLSGIIAGGLMQNKDALGAVIAAVYAHGLSGDHAAGRLSEKAMTAGDILKFLPEALKELEGE